MPCCCRQQADKSMNDPVFVRYKDRKCTDALFCMIFLLFWAGMAVIAVIAFVQGDPHRLTNGSDHEGRACGTNGLPEKVYYPRITEDIVAFVKEKRTNFLDITLFGVCVSQCPSHGDVVCTANGTVAIAAAKTALVTSTNAETLATCKLSSSYLSLNSEIRTTCATTRKHCWLVPLNTTDYFNRCVWTRQETKSQVETCVSPPSLANRSREDLVAAGLWSQCVSRTVVTVTVATEPAQSNPALDLLFSSAAKFGSFVADINNAIIVILVCGGVGSVLLGFVWLLLLRWCAGCMVWSTIFAALASAAVVTLIAYFKAGILTASHVTAAASALDEASGVRVNVTLPSDITTASANMQTQWAFFAYAMTAMSVILLFVVAWMRSSIKMAVGIIKEASVALRSMLSLLLCPVAMVLALGCLFVYWMLVTAYMASAGEDVASTFVFSAAADFANSTLLLCASDNSTANTSTCDSMLASHAFAPSNSKRFALVYHLFGLLWTSQFIMGMGIMVVAGAASQWYFTRDKHEGVPRCMCWRACARTARYHMGTVAFGSLLIAIVQFIRLILAYLDHRSKELQDRNKVVKVVFKVVQCCLWCFEKCVKFVSQYAYILVAMQGASFCPAAVSAVGTISSNIKQIGALSTITSLLFLLGKVVIVTTSSIAGFLWLNNAPAYQQGGSLALQSQLVPLAVLVLLAYTIASGFLGVYQQTVTTLLLAFCEDKAKHAGTQDDPYFMSDGLRKAVGLPQGCNKPVIEPVGIELVHSLEAKAGPLPIDTYSTEVVPFTRSMLEVLKGFGFLRIVGLFLLGMIPSYVFLTLRFSYTLPTQPCGTKGHQLLLMASSGSGLTTTVRFSLSETNLKALYIPYGTHMDETPWEAMGQFLSISRPVWGLYSKHVSETLTRSLVSLRQSDLEQGIPWKPVVFVFDDAHIPILTYPEEMKEVLKLFDTLGEHCLASVELLSTVPARTIVPTFETLTARPALVRWITSVNEDWARVLLSNSSELTEDQKDRVLEVVGARLLDITRVIKDGGSKLEEHLEAVVTEDMGLMTALLNGTLRHSNLTASTSILVAHSAYEALVRHHELRVRRQMYHVTGLDRILAESLKTPRGQPSSSLPHMEANDEDDSVTDESTESINAVSLEQSNSDVDRRFYEPMEPPALQYSYNRPLPHGPCNIPRRGVTESEFYTALEFMMAQGLLFENMENQISFTRPAHLWTYARVLSTLPPQFQPAVMFPGRYDRVLDHSFAARSEACLRASLTTQGGIIMRRYYESLQHLLTHHQAGS